MSRFPAWLALPLSTLFIVGCLSDSTVLHEQPSQQDNTQAPDTGSSSASDGALDLATLDQSNDRADLSDVVDEGVTNDDDLNEQTDGSMTDAADVEPADVIEEPEPNHVTQPVLYPDDQIQSPITGFVADRMREIASSNNQLQDNVFMKVGASGTVSSSLLYCFARGPIDLDGRNELWTTINYFLEGNGNDFAGNGDLTPYDRPTYAAKVGRTAAWVMSGNPAPIDQEIDAIQPRFALINYGTNDMGMGYTYLTAMPGFYDAFSGLVDKVIDQGIVPILTGLAPRNDSASADLWIETYNALVRGVAQSRQIPFIDLHLAINDLPSRGLSSDGLHTNVYRDSGSSRPCVFTTDGLEYGYNVRNLITIEAFDRARLAVIDEVSHLDETGFFLDGDGSPSSPFEIPALPFTHVSDTSVSPHTNFDVYDSCSDANESGPEFLYRLELDEAMPIRAIVMDRGTAIDVDIHVLSEPASEDACLARGHHMIEGTLEPGSYILSVDSWVSSSGEQKSGSYMLVVVECEPDDSDCSPVF